MKKILILLTVVCLLFVCACNKSPAETQTESDTTSELESATFSETISESETEADVILEYITINSADDLYDRERSHMPTLEQAQSIKDGMSMREVIEILGKPHGPGWTSGIYTIQWYVEGGYVIYMHVVSAKGKHAEQCTQSNDTWKQYECYYNCGTIGRPAIVPEDGDPFGTTS